MWVIRLLIALMLLCVTALAQPVKFAPRGVVLDTFSTVSGTTALTWTHTPLPNAIPKGVLVWCVNSVVSTDLFTGATYGGVAMTLVGSASDTVTEPAFNEAYFLGTGIPAGAPCAASRHAYRFREDRRVYLHRAPRRGKRKTNPPAGTPAPPAPQQRSSTGAAASPAP